jgi:hypothetical protein
LIPTPAKNAGSTYKPTVICLQKIEIKACDSSQYQSEN